jgi:outer membrane protein insertion porin family
LSWEQRARPWPRLQISYAYRFERDHTFQTMVPADSLVPAFDVTANIARLTGSLVFDTRDDPTDTTRGSLFSSSFELAPASLGSDFQFVRHIGQAYHFRPWRGVVFASAGQVGLVAPQGGQTLLPSELFFGGGARTLRGIEEGGLGPRDVFGDAAGGRAFVVFNQEVRVPVYRWIRGVGFLDTGNVFPTPGDIDVARFATSIGAGVRVATPFGLARVDWAHLLSAVPDGASRVRWTFGIGQTF